MNGVVFVVVIAALLGTAYSQCDGSCQNTSISCSGHYEKYECPGPNNVECCVEQTPQCNGQCQVNTLSCGDGKYKTDKCPGPNSVQCCVGAAPFADRYWNCGNVACSYTVSSGSGQPNYECAEFVARSLAAGGYLPGLHGLESQSHYDPYKYNGKNYDLLWVSDKEGGPLGLREYLLASDWQSVSHSDIHHKSAVFVNGANGAYGHVAIGVGDDVCDAHNTARYKVSPCHTFYQVDQVLHPGPNSPVPNDLSIPVEGEYIQHDIRIAKMVEEGKWKLGPSHE